MNATPMEEGVFDLSSHILSVKEELEALYKFALAAGGKVISYHLTPPFHSQNSRHSTVFHFGLDPEVAKIYLEPEVFESDPIPDYVMREGYCMSWRQALAGQKLKPKHIEFSKKAVALGFVDGVAAPLFGPGGRNSFFSVSFDRVLTAEDEPSILPVIASAKLAHSRICTLLRMEAGRTVELSEREREVLYWISRGKSSHDISIILEISTTTVDTYVKRIFAKLGVYDRMSAVIVGLSNSLIHEK